MKKGDFIEVDFVGRVSLTGEIFDLTKEDVAKESGIYDKNHEYKPILVIIGDRMVVSGIEKELEKMDIGEEKEFEVEPKDAFGIRNQKLIKILSLANFRKEKINPVPGAFVNINNTNARIQSVSGGRVMVDFNHPLSGKILKYKVKIIRQITDPLGKATALLDHCKIKCDSNLTVDVLTLKFDNEIDKIVKDFLQKILTKNISEIKTVNFEYKNKKTEEEKI